MINFWNYVYVNIRTFMRNEKGVSCTLYEKRLARKVIYLRSDVNSNQTKNTLDFFPKIQNIKNGEAVEILIVPIQIG